MSYFYEKKITCFFFLFFFSFSFLFLSCFFLLLSFFSSENGRKKERGAERERGRERDTQTVVIVYLLFSSRQNGQSVILARFSAVFVLTEMWTLLSTGTGADPRFMAASIAGFPHPPARTTSVAARRNRCAREQAAALWSRLVRWKLCEELKSRP